MKRKTLKKHYVLIGIVWLFACTLFWQCSCPADLRAESRDIMERSFEVSEGGTLNMDVDGASIKIETGSNNEVKVNVTLASKASNEDKAKEILKNYKIEFKHSGDDVTIESEKHSRRRGLFSWTRGNHIRVEFVVTVPEKYNLDVRTTGGSITVSDIRGKVKAKTSGGSLTFGEIKGPVLGRTSGGSITLAGCTEDVDVHTSGGGIKIGTVEGEVKAVTSGGSINVKEVMTAIDAHTSGGSVTATIKKQPKGDCRLTTSGGSVTVWMVENTAVNLDAKTSSSGVSTDFTLAVEGKRSKRHLKGEINGGGPQLYLRTSGGSIHIKKL